MYHRFKCTELLFYCSKTSPFPNALSSRIGFESMFAGTSQQMWNHQRPVHKLHSNKSFGTNRYINRLLQSSQSRSSATIYVLNSLYIDVCSCCRVAVNKWLIWSLQYAVVHPMINNLYANFHVNYYYECKASNFRWIGFFITSSDLALLGHIRCFGLDVLIIIYHSHSLLTLISVIFESFVFIFWPARQKTHTHAHWLDENRSVTWNRLGSTFPMTRIKPEFIIEYFHHIQRVFARVWHNNGTVQLGPGESCVCVVVIRTYIVRIGQGNGISFKMHKHTAHE